MKSAENSLNDKYGDEVKNLREECATLRSKMEARDEELGRLVGDMDGDGNGSGKNVASVKVSERAS